MKSAFNALPASDKADFVERLFKFAGEDYMEIDFDLNMRTLLAECPYSTSFVLYMSTKDRFRELSRG